MRKLSQGVVVAIVGAMALCTASQAKAAWIGDTVGLNYYYPDSGSLYENLGTGTVPGATFSLVNEVGVGSNTVVVNADQIVVNLDPGEGDSWSPGSFNGWVLTDLTSDPGITGVSIASQSNFALTPGDISFTSDSVTVNWAGLTFGPSSAVTLDVSFGTAVPEPASLSLFASALIGFGALRRRRRV